MADYVWRLASERSSKDIAYYLEMPKAMGERLSDEDRVLELDRGRDVRIDQSGGI